MIYTLPVTIFIEGLFTLGYSIWRKKPVIPILVISLFANLITQSLLWVVLNIFFQHYLVTLWIAELLIWLIESIFLFAFRWNQLTVRESLLLSFLMNVSSFGIGWLLPI